MIEGPSRGEFSVFGFIKNFGILGVLWREFLLDLPGGLGEGGRQGEFSNMRVVLPQYSAKGSSVSLLGIDSGSKLRVVFLHGMEVSQEISLFKYLRVIMSRDWGSPYPDRSGSPVNEGVQIGRAHV